MAKSSKIRLTGMAEAREPGHHCSATAAWTNYGHDTRALGARSEERPATHDACLAYDGRWASAIPVSRILLESRHTVPLFLFRPGSPNSADTGYDIISRGRSFISVIVLSYHRKF